MKSKLAVATLIGALSFTAAAVDQSNIVKTYELKDGSKIHVFKDGKMGMENKFGKAVSMREGQVMETKDGSKILMKGNEVFRLDDALIKGHREGS
ncbi:periplasmic Cu(I)/Cu(II)-binding protein CopK [Cupriavidus pinatubonensis]|jgi:hypothetical protein|uniref:Copper resistance protein K n=1 Tax=Cupriavidus pinatubonensis TaxID=248026 RepID=A0ABN7Y3B5_9BURK|nr:periplasmic Cu(I)/Cu(II)-binding protein CopK [Cupriavidus pinatubonensis]CAG9166450.1 Copper resistance protein K [Cupriavidus pinatubonensis]